jgi:putative membrane protein
MTKPIWLCCIQPFHNSALETTHIPSASSAELKSLLQTGLKIFQGHEQHAEHVAAELK